MQPQGGVLRRRRPCPPSKRWMLLPARCFGFLFSRPCGRRVGTCSLKCGGGSWPSGGRRDAPRRLRWWLCTSRRPSAGGMFSPISSAPCGGHDGLLAHPDKSEELLHSESIRQGWCRARGRADVQKKRLWTHRQAVDTQRGWALMSTSPGHDLGSGD